MSNYPGNLAHRIPPGQPIRVPNGDGGISFTVGQPGSGFVVHSGVDRRELTGLSPVEGITAIFICQILDLLCQMVSTLSLLVNCIPYNS